MNPRDRLGGVVGQRLRALVDNLPSACEGDVEAVHRTRVASRRMREALPCLEPRLSRPVLRQARRKTRRLTRALGSVRELDVALGILTELEADHPEHRAAIDRVRADISRRREVVRQRMLTRLQSIKPGKLVHELFSRVGDLNGHQGREAWREVLARRLARRAGRLMAAIDDAGAVYLADRLHAVRIKVKKLRYALELVEETGAAPTAARVKELKRVQDLLGRLNDREVLVAHVGEVAAGLAVDDELVPDLGAIARGLQEECRRLHGRYVAGRRELWSICVETGEETARRVWPGSAASESITASG